MVKKLHRSDRAQATVERSAATAPSGVAGIPTSCLQMLRWRDLRYRAHGLRQQRNIEVDRGWHAPLRQVMAICLLTLLGCGGDGKVDVSGTISWNDHPIEKGHIIFTPVNRAQAPDATSIQGGKYALRALPGEKKVEIFADRPVGEPDPTMHLQRYEQYIPTRFNEQTQLSVTIQPKQPNTFDFQLKEESGDRKAGDNVSTSLPKSKR